MAQIFDDHGTDGILLVDCNIQITCPEMSISSTLNPMPPTQRATNRNLHILCIKLTHLKTRWNQLMKRSTVFYFQFILVRRNRSLMSCKNSSQGGLGIPDLKAEASQQYVASKLITALCQHCRPETRVQGWLNSVALEEQDLWCKKKGFVSQRHDGIQNLLTSLLSKVCKDVEVEPHLLPMDIDVFNLSSAVSSPEARQDIKAGTEQIQRIHLRGAKRRKGSTNKKSWSWEWDLSSSPLPPVVFGTNGGMGKKMQTSSEQPSGQTFPKQRRVVCQCHILA
ncbi:unnamed protein product [Porites evermanni]|uniref:Uncharacterized protein n=1 Tax=Porites evermanni TaxID=104178 RepID=A0ABN8QWM4_9CNID|nr:unnamed protein product [Porites evermanni]